MTRRLGRLLAAAALVLTSCALAGGVASAAPAQQDAALLRGAHFSPDTPGVDVYLTSFAGGTTSLWLSNVGYGDVSPYERITPGLYAVSMRPHGQPQTTPAALSWNVNAQPGEAFTAAAIGMNSELHGIVLQDELNPPPANNGRVRLIQAASRAPHADVAAQNGPVVAHGTPFGSTTDYSTVPAGNWPLVATAEETPTVSTTDQVSIPSGSVTSVVLLDAKGSGVTLRTVTDAASAGVSPVGPVPAGGGGTAPRGDDLAWAWGALAAATGLAGVALAVRRVRAVGVRPAA